MIMEKRLKVNYFKTRHPLLLPDWQLSGSNSCFMVAHAILKVQLRWAQRTGFKLGNPAVTLKWKAWGHSFEQKCQNFKLNVFETHTKKKKPQQRMVDVFITLAGEFFCCCCFGPVWSPRAWKGSCQIIGSNCSLRDFVLKTLDGRQHA